jgi:hypothetical protein
MKLDYDSIKAKIEEKIADNLNTIHINTYNEDIECYADFCDMCREIFIELGLDGNVDIHSSNPTTCNILISWYD